MKRLLWLSLIPLTVFWLFELDINGATSSPVPTAVFILLGIAISIIGFLGSSAVLDKRYAAVLLPLILSCLIIPYPYNVGLIITAGALLISLIAPQFGPIWLGTLFAGAVLILNSFTLSIYYILAPNYRDAGWLSPIMAVLSKLTGMDAVSNQGMLLIFAQKDVFPFNVTMEKLGFYPWILILSGSLLLIYSTSRGISTTSKRIFIFLAASLIYLLLRYLILVHIFFSKDLPEFAINRIEIFIDPWWLIGSFIPLVLLFLWICPTNGPSKFDFRLNIDRNLAIALSIVLISSFCLTSAVVFHDPGIKKDGRVLVDEIHSRWEPSTLKLDKNWYGEGSTYNAYSMIEWLKDTYHVDRIVDPTFKHMEIPGAEKVSPDIVSDNLTYDILKNYDILIIETPSRYKPEEVDAIVRFVENGGGLFLIGDHTNFAGTGTNLNEISKRLGIEFGFDAVNSINGTLYQYQRGQLFHPAAEYMPVLDFMTGCSLKAPLGSEPVILGFGMGAEPGEYSSVGFFRETRSNDPTHATDTTWGLINQAVAAEFGKGRVVAFADSTITSNFRIFFGGSPNLIIGVMEYLNHKNSFENENQILFIIGLIAAILAAYLLGRRTWGDGRVAALILVLALCTLSVSGALLTSSIKGEDSVPSSFYVRNHTVSFDREHSDIITTEGSQMGQYETFFIWTQRVNLTPSLDSSMEEGMSKGRMVVVIDPVKELSSEETDSLLNYVNDGNSVLLMISSDVPWSSLINRFGMTTYPINEPDNANWSSKNGLPIEPWGLSIKGGTALLNVSGRVVMAGTNYGKGKFVLFTDSQVFKDGLYGGPGYMGYSKVDPKTVDETRYDITALYNLEYSIFEDYLKPKGN